MKRKKFEKELRKWGWWFMRHGSSHDIWTNGIIETSIPRHSEVNEKLAKSVIRMAINNPGKYGV
jgi:mRNA interferase HicA